LANGISASLLAVNAETYGAAARPKQWAPRRGIGRAPWRLTARQFRIILNRAKRPPAGLRGARRGALQSFNEGLMAKTCNNSDVSRRAILFAAAGAAPLIALSGGEAQAKLAMTAVKYQPDPKDGKQCDGCNFFVAPNSCKMVDGDIAPTGWCTLWVKKPA
jgi:hypothetical protein